MSAPDTYEDLPVHTHRHPTVRVYTFKPSKKDDVERRFPGATRVQSVFQFDPSWPVLSKNHPHLLLDAETGKPLAIVSSEELKATYEPVPTEDS